MESVGKKEMMGLTKKPIREINAELMRIENI